MRGSQSDAGEGRWVAKRCHEAVRIGIEVKTESPAGWITGAGRGFGSNGSA